MRIVSISILIFLLSGCNPSLKPEAQDATFFDLSDFIDAYCRATDSLVDVRKSITVDGEKEEKDLQDYPVQRDIRGFETLNLNKAALWDRYSVDTSAHESGNYQITYTALEDQLMVQSLVVTYDKEEVTSIQVTKDHKTFLADVSTFVEWLPGQGYTIRKNEGQMFSDPTLHEIRVDLR